jgi:hypothetical protein
MIAFWLFAIWPFRPLRGNATPFASGLRHHLRAAAGACARLSMAAAPAVVAVFPGTPVDRTPIIRLVIAARGRIIADFPEPPDRTDITLGRLVGKMPHTAGIGPEVNVGVTAQRGEDPEAQQEKSISQHLNHRRHFHRGPPLPYGLNLQISVCKADPNDPI